MGFFYRFSQNIVLIAQDLKVYCNFIRLRDPSPVRNSNKKGHPKAAFGMVYPEGFDKKNQKNFEQSDNCIIFAVK
jgi:hypothetical protein